MAKSKGPKDLDKVFEELLGAGARASITVIGSLVDHCLQEAIKTCVRTPSGREEERALFERGVFDSFDRKIWGAYFLKVIGPETKRDLHLIRQMRNYMAHNMNLMTVDELIVESQAEAFFEDEHLWPRHDVAMNTQQKLVFKAGVICGGLLCFGSPGIHGNELVSIMESFIKR